MSAAKLSLRFYDPSDALALAPIPEGATVYLQLGRERARRVSAILGHGGNLPGPGGIFEALARGRSRIELHTDPACRNARPRAGEWVVKGAPCDVRRMRRALHHAEQRMRGGMARNVALALSGAEWEAYVRGSIR